MFSVLAFQPVVPNTGIPDIYSLAPDHATSSPEPEPNVSLERTSLEILHLEPVEPISSFDSEKYLEIKEYSRIPRTITPGPVIYRSKISYLKPTTIKQPNSSSLPNFFIT